MKTIANFWKPEDAHLLRLRLGEAGIPAFLQNEHTTQIHPWRAAAVGGVSVQVSDADFDAAQRILSTAAPDPTPTFSATESDILRCFACGTVVPNDKTECPSCGWSYKNGEGSSESDCSLG
jgi:hypothetical protein